MAMTRKWVSGFSGHLGRSKGRRDCETQVRLINVWLKRKYVCMFPFWSINADAELERSELC